jgi:hypothetical protein
MAVAAIFLLYPAIKSRIFKSETKKIEVKKSESTENDLNLSTANTASETRVSENGQINSAPNIAVNPSDCDSECSRFKKDDEIDYCEQICGISDIYQQDYENDDSETKNCDNQAGIHKDYCLKDKAIESKDFKICDQIQDAAIKKTCRNRITEELISTQNNVD